MTRERDIERLLDHWFSDGPGEAPDRLVDAVADRIGRQHQRPAWRFDWRTIRMNRTLGAAAAVAAVIVIALVGFNLLRGGGSAVGPPAASPSASPSAAPSRASPGPTPVAPSATPEVGVPGACDLMTAAEAGTALQITAALTVESVGSSGPTAPSRYCSYHTADDAQGIALSYEKESGVDTFAAWKSNPGAQVVSGIGDDAVWNPATQIFYVLKGSRLVGIQAGDGVPPITLKAAKAVATIVVGRM